MGQHHVDEASAGSAVGTDLLQDHREQVRNRPRLLRAVALTGSAAAGDAEVEIYVGNVRLGAVPNNRTGTVVLDLSDWRTFNTRIPAGEKLHAFISDAGATNALRLHFVTAPLRR